MDPFTCAVCTTRAIDSAQRLVSIVRAFTLLMGQMIEHSRANEARVANKAGAGSFGPDWLGEWSLSNNLDICDELFVR